MAHQLGVAQMDRALDCGSRGRGFEFRLPPNKKGDIMNKVISIVFGSLAIICWGALALTATSNEPVIVYLGLMVLNAIIVGINLMD